MIPPVRDQTSFSIQLQLESSFACGQPGFQAAPIIAREVAGRQSANAKKTIAKVDLERLTIYRSGVFLVFPP
jgi:hypothetical protein